LLSVFLRENILKVREDLRNVAIIAHVDHGKTTLVNEILKQGGIFRENQSVADRVMDSNDLERERGITILAKNTSVYYKNTKINIVDTPGHADFGGEVERVLKMVNGVLVLVDAAEGPMPQTRFVMQKALELGHKLILVVNKTDRPDARLNEVENEILDLLLELNANESQFMSPIIYCSGRNGTASEDFRKQGIDLKPLFEAIINHFEPQTVDEQGAFQMLVSSIDYNDYVGRIAVGRIERGTVRVGDAVSLVNFNQPDAPAKQGKIVTVFQIDGLSRKPVESAEAGDIVCISGLEDVTIGDTVCSPQDLTPVPFVKISEPTVEMTFSVNDGPFAGKEGKYVTTRHLHDRLFREMLKDVSLKVEKTDSADSFKVCGRGEMHLSILIETMRRDGYEFLVGAPKVLFKRIDGVLYEPMEKLVVDVPNEKTGVVFQSMGERKGELLNMENVNNRVRMEFSVPARGLFGYKSQFLTDTRGEGVFNTVFYGYQPFKGEIERRQTGSLVAFETGEAVTYGLFNAQQRGALFIVPGTEVYEGMVVGVSPKSEDISVNVCKKKHLTNTRASGSDDALRLETPRILSLEEAIEFIDDDELLEITPKNIRIRKTILDTEKRLKANFRKREQKV
jgi:GTP-binding protein TypA/BipA